MAEATRLRQAGCRSGTGRRAVGPAAGRLHAAILSAAMLAVPGGAGAQDSFFGDLADAIDADGFYVSGAGAVSVMSDGPTDWSAVPLQDRTTTSLSGSVHYATGFAARAAVGGYFGDFRVELEAGYLASTIDDVSGTDTGGTPVDAALSLDIDRFNIGLNAYFDIPDRFEGVRPYLGVGLGYGAVSPRSVSGSVGGTRLSVGDVRASGQLNFRVIAGIEYPIDDRFTLDAGYRYIDGESLSFSAGTGSIDTAFSGHQIGLGLRYHFWSLDDPLRRRPDATAAAADRQPRGADGRPLPVGLPAAEPPVPQQGAGPDGAPVLVAVPAAPASSLPPPETIAVASRSGNAAAGRPIDSIDAGAGAASAPRPAVATGIRPVSGRRLVDSGPVAGLPRPPSPLDPGQPAAAVARPGLAARQDGRLGLPSRPLAMPVSLRPLPGRIPGQPPRRWPRHPRRDIPYGVYLGKFLSPAHARAFIADLRRLPGRVGPMRPDQLFVHHEDAFDGGVYALYGARMSVTQANAICLDLFVLRLRCQVTGFAGRQPADAAPQPSAEAAPATASHATRSPASPSPAADAAPAGDNMTDRSWERYLVPPSVPAASSAPASATGPVQQAGRRPPDPASVVAPPRTHPGTGTP